MVFARDLNGPLTSLVKQIDQATVKNADCRMGSFVVFLGAEEEMEKLRRDGKLEATGEITLPPSKMGIADKLRGFVWYRVMKKGKAESGDFATAGQPTQTFEVYRLK